MIKINLKNGLSAEFETAKEASQFIHSLYWREFRGTENGKPMAENKVAKNCVVCHSELPSHKHKLCGKESCAKVMRRRNASRWYRKHHKNKKTVPVIESPGNKEFLGIRG